MNKSTEIKINKIELVNVPDDVFNEFLKELSKTHEQYVLDDGFYVKLLKFNYDTLRKLNIDTRKLKIIEKRYKTTQTSATSPEYLSNICSMPPVTTKRAEQFLDCIKCGHAIHDIKNNTKVLSKMTWTQEICLKCKDYSNYKLK